MDTNFRIGQVKVPPMALGTMYFGTHMPAGQAMSCLDTAFESGARFWDTANNYAFWAGGTGDESESVIGRWLAAHGSAARGEVVVATKVGARPARPGGDLDDVLGLSPSAIRDQVNGSLRRLGVGHVDVLYAHIDDRDVPLAETLGAFSELVDDGKTRVIAASNLSADRLREASAVGTDHGYAALQQRFTYLVPDQDADLSPHVLLDDQVAGVCAEAGMAMLGYAPLLSGAYTRSDRALPVGYTPNPTAVRSLQEIAQVHGLDAGQAVLSWMVHRTRSVVPVVGVSRPEQVRSAWEAVTGSLTCEETARLDEARRA